jgi:hypothetical protein
MQRAPSDGPYFRGTLRFAPATQVSSFRSRKGEFIDMAGMSKPAPELGRP